MGAISQPVADLIARLVAHKEPGKILRGYRVVEKPETTVEGRDDLPRVQVQRVSIIDDAPTHTKVGFATISVGLAVASKKVNGFTAHLEDLEVVLDAIETNPSTMLVDETLDSCTVRGLRLTGEESEVASETIQTIVTVILESKPYSRASRRIKV